MQSEVATKQIVSQLAAGVASNGRKKTVIKLKTDGRRGGRSQKPAISSNPYFNMDEVAGKFKSYDLSDSSSHTHMTFRWKSSQAKSKEEHWRSRAGEVP